MNNRKFTTAPPEAGQSIDAEWWRLPAVEQFTGLKRGHVYELIKSGAIRSVVLRRVGDRESLLKIARLRERTTKSGLAAVGAQILVDLDKQLDAAYDFDHDEIWKEAMTAANKAADEASVKVRERCRELGIPDRFAPGVVGPGWRCRGENAAKERRAELRQMARRQVDAMIKEGKRKVEQISLDVQTRIIATGLTQEARAFLEQMPSPEQLMPRLVLGDLEQMVGKGEGWHQRMLDDGD